MKVETIPLIELLKEEKGSILIASHESPDADTLGSALALYLFLREEGQKGQCGL
jgi:bifunctional oligoribonuclease and PAP phosphatase NrnA